MNATTAQKRALLSMITEVQGYIAMNERALAKSVMLDFREQLRAAHGYHAKVSVVSKWRAMYRKEVA